MVVWVPGLWTLRTEVDSPYAVVVPKLTCHFPGKGRVERVLGYLGILGCGDLAGREVVVAIMVTVAIG